MVAGEVWVVAKKCGLLVAACPNYVTFLKVFGFLHGVWIWLIGCNDCCQGKEQCASATSNAMANVKCQMCKCNRNEEYKSPGLGQVFGWSGNGVIIMAEFGNSSGLWLVFCKF